MSHVRPITALLAAFVAAACARAPVTPVFGTDDVAMAGKATGAGKTNLAVFVGLDDYTGKMEEWVRTYHGRYAKTGSTPALGIFMTGDTERKNDSFRTKVTTGQAWRQGFQPIGEMNTGATPDLRNFLGWVHRENQADTTHLVIHTHGGGYQGILWDYDGAGNPQAPSSHMALQQVYKAISKGFTGSRLATLTLDACMMQTIETGEALKAVTQVVIGSEDVGRMSTIPWDRVTAGAQLPANRTAEGFAKHLVTTVRDFSDVGALTMTALRLNRDWDEMVGKVDRLSTALITGMKTEPEAIRQAARDTRKFVVMAYGYDYGQRDLIDFCQMVQKRVQDPVIKRSAGETIAAVQKVVVAHARHDSESMANGLAIFLPFELNVSRYGYEKTAFARHTHWDEFLTALNAQSGPSGGYTAR